MAGHDPGVRLRRLSALTAAVCLLSLGVAHPASAISTGVVGASGQIGGFFCRNCHTGGVGPDVVLDGPLAVDPGSSAIFSFSVMSNDPNQIAAGFNVAADGGALTPVDGQGTRLELGELTHELPKENDPNGVASFEFSWEAPPDHGVYTLFGAGTSVNLDELRLGDDAGRSVLEVYVGVSTPTPCPPGSCPTPTPTPTIPANLCSGDCNIDTQITVDELITGVSIALGVSTISNCWPFDTNLDGTVTVDEILLAVSRALSGCPR